MGKDPGPALATGTEVYPVAGLGLGKVDVPLPVILGHRYVEEVLAVLLAAFLRRLGDAQEKVDKAILILEGFAFGLRYLPEGEGPGRVADQDLDRSISKTVGTFFTFRFTIERPDS